MNESQSRQNSQNLVQKKSKMAAWVAAAFLCVSVMNSALSVEQYNPNGQASEDTNEVGDTDSVESNLSHTVPEVAPFVDINRYMGKWYEVASIPQSFQKKCVKDTTAEYELLPKSRVKVVNICTKSNGDFDRVVGRAKIADKTTFAKLKVTFVKLIFWIYQFGGKYWILDVDQDYSVALVGDPTRNYAWILSRKPSLSRQEWIDAEQKFRSQGYDTCKILTSVQTDGLQERQSLCKFVQ